MKSNALIDQLQSDTRELMITLKLIRQQDPEKLLRPPAPGKWSITQVIEHLNIYGRYYLPLLEKAIANAKPANENFKPGWLGDYFTKTMASQKNKMKTPKMAEPAPNLDSKKVIDEFEEQQLVLLELLHKARAVDMGSQRIPISIAQFIKLKMGDVFRFLIAHQQRHFLQINVQ